MASMTGLNPNESYDGSSSYFQKTVCLHDWWLIKAEEDFEGKRLAVAGFASREQQAVRVFSSAPVVKRYDMFTLETADGICVFIKGFMNKLRTSDNGFPSEVFSPFLFGFPPNWEDYAAKLLEGDSTTCVHSGNFSAPDEFATHPGLVVGKKNSSPATKQTPKNHQLFIHENKHKHDIEPLKSRFHNVSENITIDASNGSKLCNRATKDGTEVTVTPCDFWSRSSARLKNLKGNLHNSPESRYSVKHRNKNLSHTLDAFENTDGAKMNSSSRTTIQSEGRMDISDSLAGYSMGQVFGNLSVDIRSKRKGEKMAVNGSKSNRKKINSIPFVSDDLSNILQNNNCEFEGIATSSPYTDEVQDPRHQTVLRKVNAECSGDGSLQKSDVKHPLNCGNNMIQGGLKTRNNNSARSPILRHTKDLKNAVREGENNAKEESMSSKRDFIHSPESLSFGRSRSGRPLVPTLEFWRNQLPVYDSDRKMTGIKDELIVIGQSRDNRD
ncbi:hypothetical protein I3843_10G136000 [Carya illinoinensis]|uniref:SANTA domain-containing protein n=2 Tax=Carya illinoinensis TaxID=32201 RepID=A0A922J3H3_CARIL|nr:hypothetical protein I3842_10G141600 [Carya illinoinensis]KAG7960678.1 hypothetical protein I3843_10G136000 [Carya illinoinensis]